MAHTDSSFTGNFGTFSVYKMYGTDKTVVRRKGGAPLEKMKSLASLQPQRNQQSQFAGSSSTAKMVGYALDSVKHLADFPLHGHLLKLNSALLNMDTTNAKGKRSIIFSRGLHLFEGLSLNRKVLFDSVITTSIGYSCSRDGHSATIHLPALSPGFNFNNPWNQQFYRLRMNLGIVRDMVFIDGRGYQPVTPDITDHTIGFDTEWRAVKTPANAESILLKLDEPVFDEHCHLLLSIGIEFGAQSGATIEHVKRQGCGKILTMV